MTRANPGAENEIRYCVSLLTLASLIFLASISIVTSDCADDAASSIEGRKGINKEITYIYKIIAFNIIL